MVSTQNRTHTTNSPRNTNVPTQYTTPQINSPRNTMTSTQYTTPQINSPRNTMVSNQNSPQKPSMPIPIVSVDQKQSVKVNLPRQPNIPQNTKATGGKNPLVVEPPSSDDEIEITIQISAENKSDIRISPEKTILDLKNIVHRRLFISPKHQDLCYSGTFLDNQKKIKDYNIKTGSVIALAESISVSYTHLTLPTTERV